MIHRKIPTWERKSMRGNSLAGTVLVLVAMMIALLSIIVPPASADSPTVTITNYSVSPGVLLPNGLGTITITVENTAASATISERTGPLTPDNSGTTRTTDINVNIENIHLESNGIKVLTADFDRVGELGPGQSTQISFSIQAPAKSAMYYPEVWIDTTGGRSVRYPIPVNVNTAVGIQKQAILILDSSLTGSQNPGDEIPVSVTVINSGEMPADDVTVKIENVSSTVAPKNTDLYHLGGLGARERKTFDLLLLSDKNTDAGLVKVPITIRYNAIDGTPMTQSTGIDVMFKGVAELGFVSVDTNPSRLTENTPFDLTVRIENTGTGEAKQVSAKVNLPAEGTKEAFIGKIKPGNDAPAIFLLEGMKGGTYPYNLTISYTDDMGQHTVVRPMNLRVTPADTSGNIILVLIVLGILGFAGYRYWYLPKKNGNGSFPWERKN
jgi:hypothetical protein